jgi:hypothetical protein
MARAAAVFLCIVAGLSLSCRMDRHGLAGPDMQCLPETCSGGGGGGGGGEDPPSDPAPNAAGIWVGYGMGLSRCYSPSGAGINDADGDRFDDWCEQWIAYDFRPLLLTDSHDCDLRGEPAWSVKYFPASGAVRVGYWLSYYNDCGNNGSFVCDMSQPWQNDCLGHDGDSEFIVEELRYDYTTDHYVLQKAFMSAHYDTDHDFSTNLDYWWLEFPERPQGYVRAWVALGKHGNYPTRDLCNRGAFLGVDTCEGNSTESRMSFDWSRNIGSPSSPMLNCTRAKPEMQYFRPGIECYWDGYDPAQQPPPKRFFGWWWQDGANPYQGGATPYGVMIREVFEPATMPSGRPIYPLW